METEDFKISPSGKAFRALIDGIYKDKVLAPVRELMSNAADAHIFAGCELKPIEVHLPTEDELTFSVRDFGPGMDEETMRTLYTSLFESSKDDDADQTGMLGIGSKSPFAYTREFTVKSFQGGELKLYQAALGDDDVPFLAHVLSKETHEPDGMEISFSVKSANIYEFRRAYSKVMMGHDDINVNIDISRPPAVLGGVTWTIHEGNTFTFDSGSVWIKQGSVLYPVKADLPCKGSRFLIIEVAPNSFDFTINREELTLTDASTKRLRVICDEVRKEIRQKMIDEVAAAKTRPEAAWMVIKFSAYEYSNSPTFKWKGETITGLLGSLVPFKAWVTRGFDVVNHSINAVRAQSATWVVVDSTLNLPRSTKRIKEQYINKGINVYVVPDPSEYDVYQLAEDFGLKSDQFVNLGDIPDPGSNVGTRTSHTGFRKGIYDLDSVSLEWLPDDYLWLPIANIKSTAEWRTEKHGGVISCGNAQTVAAGLRFVGVETPVVLVTARGQKKVDPKLNALDVLIDTIQKNEAQIIEDKSLVNLGEAALYALGLKKPTRTWGGQLVHQYLLSRGLNQKITDKKVEYQKQLESEYPIFQPSQSENAMIGYVNMVRLTRQIHEGAMKEPMEAYRD